MEAMRIPAALEVIVETLAKLFGVGLPTARERP
jgi:hypothetical protein